MNSTVGDSNGTSYASTYLETPATAGDVYDVINWVDVVITYQTYEVVYGCWTCYDWYDPYNYSSLFRDGDAVDTGPTFSVWVWAAPVIVVRTQSQRIQLGNTGGSAGGVPGPRNVLYLKVKAFIRPPYVYGPDTCLAGMTPKSTVYKGDGRGFDPYSFNVRAMSSIMLNTTGAILPGTEYHYTGVSQQYASDGLVNGKLEPDEVLNDCYKLNRQAFAPTSNMHVTTSGNPLEMTARFFGGAADPVASVPAPETNWDMLVRINRANPLVPTYALTAQHDCYPDFEVYENSQALYQFTAASNSPISDIGPCLLGFGQINAIRGGTLQ